MIIIRRLILALVLAAGIVPAFAQTPPPVPALPDSERRTTYSISGTTCACAVNMALYGDSTDVDAWIEVWVSGTRYLSTDPAFGWTITSPTGPLSTIPRPITDAVLTFNAVQTGTVQIVGARRPRRTSQFSENRGVAARDLNQVITDLVAQNRETWDKINDVTGRTVLGQPGDTWPPLPAAATRANQLLGFNGSGQPILFIPSSVSPSSGSCVAHSWVSSISGGGAIGCTQPAFSDLTGLLTNAMVTNPPANTVKCNPTGSPATLQDCTPSQATSAGFGRIKLTTSTNFYLNRTLGTDVAGCGLATGAAACQSPQYLVNILQANYDFACQNVTVNLADSVSTYAAFQVNGPWVGGCAQPQAQSLVQFIGNTTTPSNVIIDGTSAGGGYCVQANEGASFTISGVQVEQCALGLSAPEQHAELYFHHVTWASMPAGSIGIYASRMGYIEAVSGGNTINSIGAYFLQATHQGNFRASQLNTGPTLFTLVGSLTCTNGQFAYASSQGDITFTQYTAAPFAGPAASCVQWGVDSSGLFQVLNGSTGKGMTAPGFFPGNVAGSCVGDCNVDQAAHAGTTLTSCGTSPGISGNDYYGHVLEGTSATGCNIVFNSPVGSVPYTCQITWTTAVPGTLTIAKNGNQVALSHASTSNAAFDYLCKGF